MLPGVTRTGAFLRYWLPVLVILGVILTASSTGFSAEKTSRWIGPILRWIDPDVPGEVVRSIHFLFRKMAHLIEYGLLAFFLWRALRMAPVAGAHRLSGTGLTAAVLGAAAVCASVDEYRQSLIAARTGAPTDVLLDLAGAALGVLLAWVLTRKPVPTSHSDRSP